MVTKDLVDTYHSLRPLPSKTQLLNQKCSSHVNPNKAAISFLRVTLFMYCTCFWSCTLVLEVLDSKCLLSSASSVYATVLVTSRCLSIRSMQEKKTLVPCLVMFLSPPVPMHGGLICVTFRLSVVTRPKLLEKKFISLEPFDLGSH